MPNSLILLHGALGSAETLAPLRQELAADFDVHTFDFLGHGHLPVQVFDIPALAEQVKKYIQTAGLERPQVFGYSMGGYVALYLAYKEPDLVNEIVTLGTKFTWTPEVVAASVQRLQPDIIVEKVPTFAAYLKKLHGESAWRDLLRKTGAMMQDLEVKQYLDLNRAPHIISRAHICLGEKDKSVSQDESKAFAQASGNGSYHLLPQIPHAIEQVDASALANHLRNYLL